MFAHCSTRNPTCKLLIVAALFVASPALAQAKIEYSPWVGPPQIVTGEGGTMVVKRGMEFWTSGAPPRRYQVIGRVTDQRSEEMDGGRAIGSPKLVKTVRAAGGDAVVLITRTDSSGGTVGVPMTGLGMFLAGGSKTLTTFAVIKYLD